MWVRAHPAISARRELGELRNEPTVIIEQRLRLVAPKPGLQFGERGRVGFRVRNRNLMRAKCSFDRITIDDLWPGPTLWCSKNDRRPARHGLDACCTDCARISLDRSNRVVALIHRPSKILVDRTWIVAGNDVHVVAV